jgi:hypothetical protein
MTQEHLMAWALPPLRLDNWEDTKETLHRYCQIAGKVRMELSPFRNHWWNVTLYVTTRGLSTGSIPYGPYGSATFDISFDLLENKLAVTTSDDGGFYVLYLAESSACKCLMPPSRSSTAHGSERAGRGHSGVAVRSSLG